MEENLCTSIPQSQKHKMHYGFTTALTILSGFLLTSCASVEQQIDRHLEDGVQAMMDAFKGYRVRHHTIPAGAKIICNGEEKGVAPLDQYYDLTQEQKSTQVLLVDQCEALWRSGAREDIRVKIPLDKFPTFVQLATERPADVPGYGADEEAGSQILALRQKQIEDIQRGMTGLLSLGFSLHQLSKSTTTSSNPAAPVFHSGFSPVSSERGIRWNWIQPPVAPLGSFQPFTSSGTRSPMNLTPVYPASNCVGTVVMGQCSGTVQPTTLSHYCAGAFVNGRCAGAVLFGK